jgi:uncharacterized protein YjbI with pentapeptide repeats
VSFSVYPILGISFYLLQAPAIHLHSSSSNGERFASILTWLQTGIVDTIETVKLQLLQKEAEFFKVSQLNYEASAQFSFHHYHSFLSIHLIRINVSFPIQHPQHKDVCITRSHTQLTRLVDELTFHSSSSRGATVPRFRVDLPTFLQLYECSGRLPCFDGFEFRGLPLSGLTFTDGSFTNALFIDADLQSCVFSKCKFTNAKFANVTLTGADFTDCDLSSSGITSCSLNGLNFLRAKMHGLDFSGTDITDADFLEADLTFVDDVMMFFD